MGVLTSHLASEFFLSAANKEGALKAMQNFLRKSSAPNDYVHDVEGALAATSLEQALDAASLVCTADAEGNLVSLVWGADKLPFDTHCLATLLESFARFVRAGSFLEVEEELCPCKITFKDKHVRHDYTRYDEYDGSLARARRALDKARPEEALWHLRDAAELKPDYCMAWVEMAKVLAGFGRWAEAETACRKAAEAPLKFYKGQDYNLDYSEKSFAAYLHNADYLAGEQALEQGRFEQAAAFLQRAGEALPQESTIFWSLAKALYPLGRYPECLAAAQTILSLNPRHTYGNYFSAFSLYQLGRAKEALPYFSALSKTSPTWLHPLCVYAAAAQAAGDAKTLKRIGERILKQAERELKKNKGESSAWTHASRAHALLALGRWDEARQAAEQADGLLAGRAYILNLLGAALLLLGLPEQAAPHLQKAVELDPVWEDPAYNLARCYSLLGREREAEPLFARALERCPRLRARPGAA